MWKVEKHVKEQQDHQTDPEWRSFCVTGKIWALQQHLVQERKAAAVEERAAMEATSTRFKGLSVRRYLQT